MSEVITMTEEKPYCRNARAMTTKDLYEYLDQTWNHQDKEGGNN